MKSNMLKVLMLAASFGLAACGDDTVGLDERQEAVAGSYVSSAATPATVLTTTEVGETIDWLAQGAVLTLELRANGTTAGRLMVPGMDEDGGDFDVDLTGTWTLQGDTIHLDHEADTFLRDMPLRVEGNRLIGDRTFDGVRVQVVFRR